jgi:hypothetical protein
MAKRERTIEGLREEAAGLAARMTAEALQRRDDIARLQGELAIARARIVAVASVDQAVLDRAAVLIGEADTTLSGGEAKRHQVYARLIKDFPATPKRELGLAIELALFHSQKEG